MLPLPSFRLLQSLPLYRRALAYYRPDRRLILTLLFLIAFSITLGLLQAWPTAVLIDAVLTHSPKSDFFHRLFLFALPKSKLAQVIGITLIGMAMKIIQDTITMVRVMINNRLKYNGCTRSRAELFDKLQALHAAYHKSRPQGDAIYRLQSDTLGPFGILDTFIATSVAAVTLAVMTAIMLSRSVPLTLYALSITPFMVAVNLYFGRTIKRRAAESKQIDTDFTTLVQRSVSAIGLIQLFSRQSHERHRFSTAVRNCTAAWMRLNWQENLYPLAVNIIYALAGAIVFGYGGYLVYRDNFLHPATPGALQIGDLMVFMVYLGGLWDPLRCLTGFSAAIQGHAAAVERVCQVLDHPIAVADAPGALHLPTRARTLTLTDVCFRYTCPTDAASDGKDEAPHTLDHVSARITPGQFVAFVGPSGAGKSTLLSLLPRFYDPTAGSIKLDGHDLRSLTLASLRNHVAVVSQDNLLLPTSIAENIAYGCPGATPADIRRAAQLAGADAFIESLPDGYDTVLTENAQNLSGGQRQRIAIARALLTDAPILVLDEPTSAQDPALQQQILATLSSLRAHRTIVLVTHHLPSAAAADHIYVLDQGRIVERGTHAHLLNQGGLYASLTLQESTPDLPMHVQAA